MSLDEEKYRSLRDSLKSSPRIMAKKDFDTRLLERIREAEKSGLQTDALKHHPQVVNLVKPKSRLAEMLSGLFKPSFVPALGLTVVLLVAVVVYFGYFSKMTEKQPQQNVSANEEKHGDLVIYIRGEKDSFAAYPKEFSTLTEEEAGVTDMRTSAPTDIPSDYIAPPEGPKTEREAPALERDGIRLDKVSEEQKIEMQKEYRESKDGFERKSDDKIMKKESKSDIKTSKTEGKLSDEKKNVIINQDAEQDADENQPKGEVNQQVDTGNEEKTEPRISRAIKKDSTTNKVDSNNSNETIQQK